MKTPFSKITSSPKNHDQAEANGDVLSLRNGPPVVAPPWRSPVLWKPLLVTGVWMAVAASSVSNRLLGAGTPAHCRRGGIFRLWGRRRVLSLGGRLDRSLAALASSRKICNLTKPTNLPLTSTP